MSEYFFIKYKTSESASQLVNTYNTCNSINKVKMTLFTEYDTC